MFGLEIDARFVGSSSVVLSDPSDGDTIAMKAGSHAPLTTNFLFLPFPGKIRPYLLAGGGADIYLAGAASYTSRFGYQIDVPAPKFKERFDPEVHVGGGIFVNVGKRWGVRLDSRYVWIFDQPAIRGVSLAAGFFLSF
jgi:outer membrane protein W